MSRLRRLRPSSLPPRVLLPCCLLIGMATAALLISQSQGNYTILRADGRRTLPYRTAGQTEMVALEQLRDLFGLRYRKTLWD